MQGHATVSCDSTGRSGTRAGSDDTTEATMTNKSQGQLDYEADCAQRPTYHDGTPR